MSVACWADGVLWGLAPVHWLNTYNNKVRSHLMPVNFSENPKMINLKKAPL
jgi:hypothetical protein